MTLLCDRKFNFLCSGSWKRRFSLKAKLWFKKSSFSKSVLLEHCFIHLWMTREKRYCINVFIIFCFIFSNKTFGSLNSILRIRFVSQFPHQDRKKNEVKWNIIDIKAVWTIALIVRRKSDVLWSSLCGFWRLKTIQIFPTNEKRIKI